jgi:hypothetical protein
MLISCPHLYRHFGFAGTTFTGERDNATTRGSDELGTAGEGSWIDQHCCIGLLLFFVSASAAEEWTCPGPVDTASISPVSL